MTMVLTEEDIKNAFPDRNYESGYLTIKTIYTPNPSNGNGGDEALIEANARVAWAVRKVIEARGGRVKGAVVEGVKNGEPEFYAIVSLRLEITEEDPNPIQAVAATISDFLNEGILVNSNIKVDTVDTAKARITDFQTGLEGPP